MAECRGLSQGQGKQPEQSGLVVILQSTAMNIPVHSQALGTAEVSGMPRILMSCCRG